MSILSKKHGESVHFSSKMPGMNLSETLRELEKAGSDATRRTFARHGVKGPMFGVSFATLGALKKKIKNDHALARQLWASGNHDARILATMIADPGQMSDADLEAWIGQLDNTVLTDAVSGVAAQAIGARRKMQQWIGSTDEWTSSAGWNVCARLAGKPGTFTAGELDALLKRIEASIAAAPNRTRHSMNAAIISIGSNGGDLMRKAIAAAKRIGQVEVDHGETNCETPDAAEYIMKVVAHKAGKRAKAAKASKPVAKKTKKKVLARR